MKTHRSRGGAPTRTLARYPHCALVAALLGGPAALVPGCATHANYPAIERDFAVNDPNVHPIPGLMRRSLVRVLGDDRLHGRLPERWALNLPKGTGLGTAERLLAETMEQAGVVGGELVSLENDTLPIYSVTRVWIRGDQGEADVVRPVAWVGLDDRPWSLQKITLRLRGGRFKWDVVTARAWPVGTATTPELFGWPQLAERPAEPSTQPTEQSHQEMLVEVSALPEAFTQDAPAEPFDATAASPEPVQQAPPTQWHAIPQPRR